MSNTWAVILAGGNGNRLQSLTRVLTGDDRPKQFCALLGDKTLLAQTRARVALNVPPNQTLCVVTRAHERYYRKELADMRMRQLIEQPSNRGTAAAIAYSAARVGRKDKKAIVGFFPADHYYEDTDTFQRVVDETYAAAQLRPDLVFLLGTEPATPEVEYGWIEPKSALTGLGTAAYTVSRFWEKPSIAVAQDLLARGCLWNMFVMIGSLGAFRSLLAASVPDMMRAFDMIETFPDSELETIERVYQSFTATDFSGEVLAHKTARIGVVRVPHVGWTDLGQPARVHSLLASQGATLGGTAMGVAS